MRKGYCIEKEDLNNEVNVIQDTQDVIFKHSATTLLRKWDQTQADPLCLGLLKQKDT